MYNPFRDDPNDLPDETLLDHAREGDREVADNRMEELIDAYMKVGAEVYRSHPFYEPPEQAARLRVALRGVSMVRTQGENQ